MIKILVVLALAWAVWHFVFRKPRPAMTAAEARAVLGVAPDADSTAVQEAHRRMILRVHPDAGGSDELARRVNRARDILLVRDNKTHR